MVVCRIHNTCHRVPIDLMFHLYVSVMIQLILTLKMTTAQVVETSVTVNNNSPIQDYVHPRHSYSTNLPSVVFTFYVEDEMGGGGEGSLQKIFVSSLGLMTVWSENRGGGPLLWIHHWL